MHKIGKPLINLNFLQQKFEADFRYSMVRLRENAEGIALYQGEEKEKDLLEFKFHNVWQNTWKIMGKQKQIVGFNSGYSQIAIIFPIMIAAPSYFSGAIKLGGLMQVNNAFGQVMSAVSWFVDSYSSIASWKASVDRLTTYNQDMENTKNQAERSQLNIIANPSGQLTIRQCSVILPEGETLSTIESLTIQQGQHTLISGRSGIGKSSLVKTIAGIWPFSSGQIEQPENSLFLPQKPYLPIGSLREVLCYPNVDITITDDELQQWLERCLLGNFSQRLDNVEHWAHIMSPGEQQRVAIMRALLQKPTWLFLDEATSSLDEETEALMYQLLEDNLPGTTRVSVAHRTKVAQYHNYRLHANYQENKQQVSWNFNPIEEQ